MKTVGFTSFTMAEAFDNRKASNDLKELLKLKKPLPMTETLPPSLSSIPGVPVGGKKKKRSKKDKNSLGSKTPVSEIAEKSDPLSSVQSNSNGNALLASTHTDETGADISAKIRDIEKVNSENLNPENSPARQVPGEGMVKASKGPKIDSTKNMDGSTQKTIPKNTISKESSKVGVDFVKKPGEEDAKSSDQASTVGKNMAKTKEKNLTPKKVAKPQSRIGSVDEKSSNVNNNKPKPPTKLGEEELTPDFLQQMEEQKMHVLRKKNNRFPKAMFFCRLCDYHLDRKEDCEKHMKDNRHCRRKEICDVDAILRSMPNATEKQVQALTDAVEKVFEKHGIDQSQRKIRADIVARLEKLLQEKMPEVLLFMYGSSLTGFGLKTGDINVNLNSTNKDAKLTRLLTDVYCALKDRTDIGFSNIHSDFSAKVPALKLTDDGTQLQITMTIHCYSAHCSSELLSIYADVDERVRKLAVGFRYWANLCGLDKQCDGFVPPQALNLMVIYFLQHITPQLVPIIHPPNVSGEDVGDFRKDSPNFERMRSKVMKSKGTTTNNMSVGDLWLRLLKYYSLDFDTPNTVVSIRSNRDLPRTFKPWNSKKLAVEDPFMLKKNVTRMVNNSRIYEYWQDSIRKAYHYFGLPRSQEGVSHLSEEDLKEFVVLREKPETYVASSSNTSKKEGKTELKSASKNAECEKNEKNEDTVVIDPNPLLSKFCNKSAEKTEVTSSKLTEGKGGLDSKYAPHTLAPGKEETQIKTQMLTDSDLCIKSSIDGEEKSTTGGVEYCVIANSDESSRTESVSGTDCGSILTNSDTVFVEKISLPQSDLSSTCSTLPSVTSPCPGEDTALPTRIPSSQTETASRLGNDPAKSHVPPDIVDSDDGEVKRHSYEERCEMDESKTGTGSISRDKQEPDLVSGEGKTKSEAARTSSKDPEKEASKPVEARLLAELALKDCCYEFTKDFLTDGKGPTLVCTYCEKEGHLKNACPEDELPEILPLPPITPFHLKVLTETLNKVPSDVGLSDEGLVQRKYFLADLEAFIQRQFDDARLDLFGSSCNGFGFYRSDMDICMTFTRRNGYKLDKILLVEALARRLKQHQELTGVQAIPTAKVPIVKFTVKKNNLEGDISLYNTLAQQNTHLLYCYSVIDPRVRILGYAIKTFAKVCDIGDASRGSLSSYAYILMMLYYLQQVKPPVIPVLQELYEGEKKPQLIIEGCDGWFMDNLSKLDHFWPEKGQNKKSVAELWLGFMRFYVEEFNYKELVVSIRQKSPLTRFDKLWNGTCIAVEDPFDLSHNLGSGLTRKMNNFIFKTFINGRMLYGSPVDDNKDMFNTYQRPSDYFFDPELLSECRPPNVRGCRRCGKIGHLQRHCPANRKDREEEQHQQMLQQKAMQQQKNHPHHQHQQFQQHPQEKDRREKDRRMMGPAGNANRNTSASSLPFNFNLSNHPGVQPVTPLPLRAMQHSQIYNNTSYHHQQQQQQQYHHHHHQNKPHHHQQQQPYQNLPHHQNSPTSHHHQQHQQQQQQHRRAAHGYPMQPLMSPAPRPGMTPPSRGVPPSYARPPPPMYQQAQRSGGGVSHHMPVTSNYRPSSSPSPRASGSSLNDRIHPGSYGATSPAMNHVVQNLFASAEGQVLDVDVISKMKK